MKTKILVVRNDKIGDFMLAWPSFAMLKKSLPYAQIDVLVPEYTKPLAELCPWIDNVIIDSTKKEDQKRLIATIKNENYSDYICLFSTIRNALLGRKAKIPYRLAPATKLAQFLFTDKLKQRRSASIKPEYEYNLDLMKYFLQKKGIFTQAGKPPYLKVKQELKDKLKVQLFAKMQTEKLKLCFVHAGSGGSATNLSLMQYAELINKLNAVHSEFGFVLTAGPGEEENAKELQMLLDKDVSSYVLQSKQGLLCFCETISCADLFMAGSTGPLHIAGACNVPTIGFFPAKRSATALRWKPLNSDAKHLAFSSTSEKNENELCINTQKVLTDILSFVSELEINTVN